MKQAESSCDPAPPIMQQLSRTFTTMLFVAHALLGCCAHRACGSGAAANDVHGGVFACHADGDCSGAGCPSPEPADNDQSPVGPCRHDSCSFVKVPPVRVDQGSSGVLCVAAEMHAATIIGAASQKLCDAGHPAVSYAAPLYVRFCALLI